MNNNLYADNDKNALRHSAITRFEDEVKFTGFAAKFVLSGKETYHIKNKKFEICQGEYIVGNSDTISTVKIKGDEVVKGICIDVSEKIISDVADFHYSDNVGLKDFLLGDQFLVNKYNSKKTSLGYALNEIGKRIETGKMENGMLSTELFYSIAESIITDHSLIYSQFSKLNNKRQETNEDIYRQLLTVKSFIDEHLVEELNLDELSRSAFISKYHFIRLFKTTFNLSPYQYILRKRLEYSKVLLGSGISVQDTAARCGFADSPSFSKAFKSTFGSSPSVFLVK